jgi:uncharacterized protein YxeA
MKRTAIILISALMFFVVPTLATAAKHSNEKPVQHVQQKYEHVKDTRHEVKRSHVVQQQLKQDLRQTQWQLKQIKQRQQYQAKSHQRSVTYRTVKQGPQPRHSAKPVVIGFPRIFLSFDF